MKAPTSLMALVIELLSILAWCGPLVVWEQIRPIGHWDWLRTWPAEWHEPAPRSNKLPGAGYRLSRH